MMKPPKIFQETYDEYETFVVDATSKTAERIQLSKKFWKQYADRPDYKQLRLLVKNKYDNVRKKAHGVKSKAWYQITFGQD